MTSRRLTAAIIAGLTVALLASPLVTPDAEAATSRPSYKTQTVTRTFTTNIRTYTLTYQKPVVTGITKKVKRAIDAKVEAFFNTAIASRTNSDKTCDPAHRDPDSQAHFTGTISGGLHQKRYLSVFLGWDVTACEDVGANGDSEWLNLDVKTGKTVSLSKFARTKGDYFAYAVGVAIAQKTAGSNPDCWRGRTCWPSKRADDMFPDLQSWRDPSGWTVNNAGITVYFRAEENWVPRFLVPWASITRPSEHLKRTTTTFSQGDFRAIQHGRVVMVTTDSDLYWIGIRPTGSKTAKLFAVAGDADVYLPGSSIRFKSASSHRVIADWLR